MQNMDKVSMPRKKLIEQEMQRRGLDIGEKGKKHGEYVATHEKTMSEWEGRIKKRDKAMRNFFDAIVQDMEAMRKDQEEPGMNATRALMEGLPPDAIFMDEMEE